ncbi:patatin-like phospholipase family protein [Flammeovirgaceae bacterium SG7u.111]|nr:patatin-like phospholipase family protein [Flammeovirgaceae bacterium SG7u.132]WPO38000.1 patatin-like phospholipase family protein [Flammeovirgaceae bacterium SG7u.111]
MKKIVLCLVCLIVGLPLFSQEKERPKIGLVLSGGGAKGIAHIGVLKAMEEAGLYPDYITGTSMGSIVGGLYSIGYSTDELERIVKEVDWSMLLTNKTPMNKVTFEEKFYYGRYLLDFYVEKKKIQFPKGVIEGQALMELFSTLTRPVHTIHDFNDFPIPFACVGTNIVTGEPVVLNKGSLAMSMRASMAIPSIFTPIKIDDQLLVDGGLVRNMPVQEVLDMGADIVIGVFVSSDLSPEKDLTSPLAILSQSAFITSAFDSREQLKNCDILITPDLEGFSTGSFSDGLGILERGNEAGQEYLEVFKNLADSIAQFGKLNKVDKPEIFNEYNFSRVEVNGNEIIQDEFIIGKMKIEPGLPVNIKHIESRVEVIYGTQYFEKIWYEIDTSGEEQVLKLYVVERPKAQLRFSYHYDSENKGGVVGNVTMRNWLLNRSRFIFEADLSTNPRVWIDYFKYLGKDQNTAIGAAGTFTRNELSLYDSVGNVTSVFSSGYSSSGIKLQSTRVQSSTFGVEVLWSNMVLKPKVADGLVGNFSKLQYNKTAFEVFYKFDNYNDRYFPTRGVKANFWASTTTKTNGEVTLGDSLLQGPELGDLLQTSGIHSANFAFSPIIPLLSNLSLITKLRLRLSSIGNNTLNLDEYDFVGGFSPGQINANEFYGGGLREFGLANYFYGKLGLQYEVKKSVFVQGVFNYLDTEYPVTWVYPDADIDKAGDSYRRYGYGGVVGLRSPVGPIAFAFAKDHHRKGWKTSLIVGFHF